MLKLWWALSSLQGRPGACEPPRRPGRRSAIRSTDRITDSFYRGRKVMITGGLGFIGSNLARRLVELGAQVLLVDSLIPDYGGNLFNIRGIETPVAGERRRRPPGEHDGLPGARTAR